VVAAFIPKAPPDWYPFAFSFSFTLSIPLFPLAVGGLLAGERGGSGC